MSLSPQEIFDRVATHLLTQGRPSVDISEACLYRGPNGLKCAVGALIPDELYNPELEGNSCFEQGVKRALTDAGVIDEAEGAAREAQLDLLSVLQSMHDDTAPRFWHEDLRRIAIRNRLNTTALNHFPQEAA